MKKKSWRKWLIVLLVIVVAAAVVLPQLLKQQGNVQLEQVSSYTVGRGDVAVTITGSGMLEVKDTLDVMLPANVEVSEVLVEQGDRVETGDVLAVLDRESLEYRAAELSAQLASMDQQLSVRREVSTIQAPIKGRVKYLPVDDGDDVIETVNAHGALAILSTDDLMQIEVETDAALEIGDEVKVKWASGSEKGQVISRIKGGYLITLDDKKAPYHENASVYDGAELIGEGVLEIHAPMAIYGNGGIIKTVHVKLDDAVTLNAKLFTLENEPATDAYRQTLADRQDVAEQLQMVLKYQLQPEITTSEAGIVNAVQAVEGKKLSSQDNSGEATGFVLGVGGAVKMVIDVDELDISNIALDQQAKVTLDAFASESFDAVVKRISYIGKATGSITNYEVELELIGDDRLLVGMNGSAVIQSQSVEDVVIVPLSVVHEDADGSYVYLLDSADQQVKTYITTGLANATYAEVLSGLKSGDRIAYSEHKNTFVTPLGVTVDADMMRNSPMGGMLGD